MLKESQEERVKKNKYWENGKNIKDHIFEKIQGKRKIQLLVQNNAALTKDFLRSVHV